jgi:hypothetical protein
MVREFFLYVDGWDKDSDFHVVTGTQVEPLPFHGMNDQLYGREPRPRFPSDALHDRYNTRWVEGRVLKQIVSEFQFFGSKIRAPNEPNEPNEPPHPSPRPSPR